MRLWSSNLIMTRVLVPPDAQCLILTLIEQNWSGIVLLPFPCESKSLKRGSIPLIPNSLASAPTSDELP